MNYLDHRTIGSYECEDCAIYVTEAIDSSFDDETRAFYNEVAQVIIDSHILSRG